MFSVFGEENLEPINTNATSTEITDWKNSPKTAICFSRLLGNVKGYEEFSYMSRICEKVWPKSKVSAELSVFAIAICKMMLNPKTETIQMNELNMKNKIHKNKVLLQRTLHLFIIYY